LNWARAIGNGILLTAAAVPGFPAIWHPEVAPIMGGISAFFLFIALINTLRGTGCRVHLVTAVNVQRLGMLQRLPAAIKLFRRIQPVIETAQGPLGDVGALLEIEPAPAAPAAGSVQPAAVAAPRNETSSLSMHKATCQVLGLMTVVGLGHILAHTGATLLVECLVLLGLLIVSAIALATQSGRNVPKFLRAWAGTVIAYELAVYSILYFVMIRASLEYSTDPLRQYRGMFKQLMDMSGEGILSAFTAHACVVAGALLLCTVGIALLRTAGPLVAARGPVSPPPPPPPLPIALP
jgi:hypothetical protein